MEKMGQYGLENLKKRIHEKIYTKLLDEDEEVIQLELLEAKGKALRELLHPEGASR